MRYKPRGIEGSTVVSQLFQVLLHGMPLQSNGRILLDASVFMSGVPDEGVVGLLGSDGHS